MPHFSGNIELGQILMIVAMFLIAMRVLQALDGLELEHEMLIDDYCERKYPGVPVGEARKRLLTRRRRHFMTILLSGGRRD